ncbi:alpha-L-arabinofuranosidase C-terminal domain-containing protein [Blastococcus sp. TF02A_35]|uniref:alpha-L-arabinofuranosidase C-terminal domain-containing protein n=1 Tax=Blastococcus sp. TF02A-35 TaxID=2559612 RepID=UPI00107355C6|nr:alpha-L-arabinofuranosidase C-terminal domain-containing protein [Blastococcus sp. TF02A_35]TFV49576.1 hypothetical protein E4P43_12055 [Blastococcus sp. TF02A_35]
MPPSGSEPHPTADEPFPATATATVRPGAGPRVSPLLFGLFLEDINFACDGGLNANLVNNHSFEGVYLDRERSGARRIDRTRHWSVSEGVLTASGDGAVVPGRTFGRVESAGEARLSNPGYPGGRPGMAFRGPLRFTALVRGDGYRGALEVGLLDGDGEPLATAALAVEGTGWREVSAVLEPSAEAVGSLELWFAGEGVADLDEVRLVAEDHWGAGDPRWSQGLLRRDLVEALRDLHPRFLRFPGGCIVEGSGGGTHYKWKDTVGPLAERRAEASLWGERRADGDYSQSYQVGFYEYFLLCEDLGIEPLPVVWAGMSCQLRGGECVPLDGPELDAVVQDAVDLLDWATGDPATSAWAALRAQAGHPEPFALSHLGIGNENFGPGYLARFERIRAAVDAHRPGLSIVLSSGYLPEGASFEEAWAFARPDAGLVVDEHFYRSPRWVLENVHRYDGYPRGGATVFLGEYAAHPPHLLDQGVPEILTDLEVDPGAAGEPRPNTWASALAEAAFLTGVERNSDVVAMTSYAPLLELVEHEQWAHNLLDFSPLHVLPTANYLVQQAFAASLGERVAPVEGALPGGVHASATSDDGTAYVKLVNVGEQPRRLDLGVEGAGTGPARGSRIAAPPDAVNRLGFTGGPQVQVAPGPVEAAVEAGHLDLTLPPHSVTVLRVPLQA